MYNNAVIGIRKKGWKLHICLSYKLKNAPYHFLN